MEWVNLNERMAIGKSHLGFTFRKDSKGRGVWMRILSGRGFAVVAAAMVVVFGVSGSSWARTVKSRVHAGLKSSMHLKTPSMLMHGEAVVPGVMPEEIAADGSAAVSPDE